MATDSKQQKECAKRWSSQICTRAQGFGSNSQARERSGTAQISGSDLATLKQGKDRGRQEAHGLTDPQIVEQMEKAAVREEEHEEESRREKKRGRRRKRRGKCNTPVLIMLANHDLSR